MASRVQILAVAVAAVGSCSLAMKAEAQVGPPASAASGRPDPVLKGISDACGSAAWSEASKLGATLIEATLAGQAKRDRQGRVTVPVRVRITYPRFPTYEVKEAVITCTVDKSGRVIGAGTP